MFFFFFRLCSIIYDPKASDNEAQSAVVFEAFCSELNNAVSQHTTKNDVLKVSPCSQSFVDTVVRYIMATKTHKLCEGDEENVDAQLFLDFDLQVLAWPAEQYDEYARQIRQEYQHFSDKDFNAGRARVLRAMCSSSAPIYFSKQFEPLQQIAQNNVEREIKFLEKS